MFCYLRISNDFGRTYLENQLLIGKLGVVLRGLNTGMNFTNNLGNLRNSMHIKHIRTPHLNQSDHFLIENSLCLLQYYLK